VGAGGDLSNREDGESLTERRLSKVAPQRKFNFAEFPFHALRRKGYKEEPQVERRANIVALDDPRYIFSLHGGCSIVLRLTKKGACPICR
jgi:hypothetical protein